MKMKQIFGIICDVVMMVIISSCGAGQLFEPTFTPTPTQTNTPSPTPTATSTSTATPSLTPTNTPTNTPSVTNGTLKPGSVIVFSTDFNKGLPPQFSGIADIVGVQGYAGYGLEPNVFSGYFLRNFSIPPKPTTLALDNLPAHTSIDLHFLLAIIDSWDGYGPDTCCGPDKLTITVDGKPILDAIFDNAWNNGSQEYRPPQSAALARDVELGFRDIDDHDQDSAYDTSQDPRFSNIPHTSNTLTVEWYASGENWQGGDDESWAIDNLVVILNTENP